MKKILFLLAASFFAFQLTCFASINITNLTGTIEITPAGGGAPVTIKAGDPVPAIADGSAIKVLSGSLTVATTDPSTVNLSIGTNSITLASGNTINLALDATGVSDISVSNGSASVKTNDGKTAVLDAGNAITIVNNEITSTAGQVKVTLPNGTTTTLNASSGGNNKPEPYTPPPVNNLGQINTNVKGEESAADISPVK